MKKNFCFLFAVLFLAYYNLQGQIKIAPEVGLHLANINYKYTDNRGSHHKDYALAQPGLRVGLTYDHTLGKRFSIQTAAHYLIGHYDLVSKQDFTAWNLGMVDHTQRLINQYAQIPLMILYKTGEGKKHRLYLGVGTYANIAIIGKYYSYLPEVSTDGTSYQINKTSRPLNYWSSRNNDFQPIELGFSGTVGFEFPKGAYIRTFFQHSANNLLSNNSTFAIGNQGTWHNWSLGLTIGFYFGDDGNGIW